MTTNRQIDSYIEKHGQWEAQLTTLRNIFLKTDMTEELKWGSPTYTLNGKLVAGFAAFKKHFAIWFHQGVFLEDEQKVLSNAQPGVTRGMRQWKFEEGDNLDEGLILEYLLEAKTNCLQGKEIKPQRKKGDIALPQEMKDAFAADPELGEAFHQLTPGRKREYTAYISQAKQAATKLRRLEKIRPMIRSGKGLNDAYR